MKKLSELQNQDDTLPAPPAEKNVTTPRPVSELNLPPRQWGHWSRLFDTLEPGHYVTRVLDEGEVRRIRAAATRYRRGTIGVRRLDLRTREFAIIRYE